MEEDDIEDICSESSDDHLYSYMRKIEEKKERDAADSKDIDDMAVEDWVLAKFLGKKTIKHFVEEITDFDTGQSIIEFMRNQSIFNGAATSKYPPKADVSSVEKNDIVYILLPTTLKIWWAR
ncbi:hypothetical protein JTB14_010099 [Gonioctena quinquepunctata]|nr:hypothetical protein JTB14_010099 [Gonioctena quinquepunctata]